jgi:hypothetical protein
MKKILVLIISLHVCINLLAREKSVTLTPGFTIYFEGVQSEPINKAIEILQRDLVSVLGEKSPVEIVEEKVNATNSLVIIYNGPDNKNTGKELVGFERHKLYVQNNNLILQGADEMATIFAIYTFSEKFLGIKPLWYWASEEPTPKKMISISNDYEFDSEVPYVKYRAWFPNDQDMFSPWRDLSEINDEILYETLLRLKLNTIEVENSIDYGKIGAVTDRAKIIAQYGLIMTFHHHSPMNSKSSDWVKYWKMMGKSGAPEFKLSNMTELEEFWRYNVKTLIDNGITNIIWGVNFRGNGDIPFWTTYTDAPENMEARAAVINNAVKRQVEILKEENGGHLPMTRMIFYDEISDLLADGLLKPPAEENLIWNYVAARRDHFPNDDIRNQTFNNNINLGYYMNLQFTSTGSHLAQAEGLWKMEKNYRYIDSKNEKPLAFSVLNAGNIREHVLTLSANAQMLWDFKTYDSDGFLKQFCEMYFGNEQAESIAGLYKQFFYAYWNPKKNDIEGFDRQYIFQDLRYKQAVKQLSVKFFDTIDLNPLKDYSWEQLPNRSFRIVPADNGADNQVDALLKGTKASYEKFQKVVQGADSIFPNLNPEAQVFFNDNLRFQACFMMHLNDAVYHYFKAYIAESQDNKIKLLQHSHYAAEKARLSLYDMAHGNFETWYAHERIFDIDDFVSRIQETYNTLQETKLY